MGLWAVLKICASPPAVAPSLLCLSPRALFLSPRAQARGPSALACLGKTQWEAVAQAYFFVAPSEARGPSALTRLGMTKREARFGKTSRCAVPYEVRDAVPNEVRDASLTLDMTRKGGST
jgi:hypothetical protein